MSASADLIDANPWFAARNYRRRRPLEQARGWIALISVNWASRRVVLAAIALAVLGHLGLLALWLEETPAPPPPLRTAERLSVRLFDPVTAPAALPPVLLPATPTAQAPAAVVSAATRPPLPVTAEVTAPTAVDEQSERLSIDWAAAINGAARAQLENAHQDGPEPLSAPLPRLPGEATNQWSKPRPTVQDRARIVAGMLSSSTLVGGDGLHSLVAGGPMEQEIDSRMRDLQEECHPTADGRLECPQRQR